MKPDPVIRILSSLKTGSIDKLTPSERKLLDILHLTDNIIMIHGTGRTTARMVAEAVSTRYDTAVSIAQANHYIRLAQSVMGSRIVFDKQYYRGFLMERIVPRLNIIEKSAFPTIKKTETEKYINENGVEREREIEVEDVVAGDPKLVKEWISLLQLLRELLQLDKEDKPLETEFDRVVITNSPKTIGMDEAIVLSEAIEQKLLEYGAQKDENGNWK